MSVGRVMDSPLTQTPVRDDASLARPVPSSSPAAHAVGKENASSNSAAPTQAMYSEEVRQGDPCPHRVENATKTVAGQCCCLGKLQSPPQPSTLNHQP